MKWFDKHQDTNEVRDFVQDPTSVSKNHEQSHTAVIKFRSDKRSIEM